MSANTYLQVSELDFDDIRSNLKTYLSSQTQFTDYDFEGSAMAVLLDVLAYNTHYNAYYLNMVGNEMFLDTAQQRDSVVSRAKEMGYTPISAIGASATVKLTFNGVANTVTQFTIPKNSKFTATVDDVTYTFVTPAASKVINSNNVFSTTATIKEGLPLTHKFTVDADNPVRYIIPNKNVDMTSISVSVQESATDTTTTEFTRATNVTQVFSTTPVYFLEEASDGKYEIVFGSGSLGKSVKDGNIITIDYLVCNGETTNGVENFTVESVTLSDSVAYDSITISTTKKARGGRPQETVDSIKFNAPRNYQTQNRAIVDNDYQRILTAENPDLQSVVAFGGEQADPPVYGKVYIAVKPFGENFVTANRKVQLRESILDRTPLSVDPVFIDPDYTYIVPTITTYYDKTLTTINDTQIEQNVRDAVASFSSKNLERFGNKLRYSRFVRSLDNTNSGYILNNDATLKIEKRFVPNTSVAQKVTLNFNNELRKSSISSTQFTYSGFEAYLDDDGLGNVNIFRYNQAKQKVNIVQNAGTIDYTTGMLSINSFNPSAYADIELKVSATPERFDVTPVREQILIMQSADAIITVIGETT